MSLAFKTGHSSLLDHGNFTKTLYKDVSCDGILISYELLRNLFSIQSNKKQSNRKRTHNANMLQDATLTVQKMFETFLTELPTDLKVKIYTEYSLMNTSDVRDLSKKLFESTVLNHTGMNGGNNSDTALKCKIRNKYFLLPPKSRFFCGCVKEQCKKLAGSKFDILIADPPWWNKFIRRLKSANDKLSYSMMYNEDIASIPVQDLLSPNCLVAVWCTNAPSNVDAVKNIIFPQWGVTYITTWYWMKITVDMHPLCSFGSENKKQPYERLMIGKVGDVSVPETQMFMSVPSALHSHKPPLLDLLKQYVRVENPQILELFARYLLPNTTSVGFEPLKWQHISLYDNVTDSKVNDR